MSGTQYEPMLRAYLEKQGVAPGGAQANPYQGLQQQPTNNPMISQSPAGYGLSPMAMQALPQLSQRVPVKPIGPPQLSPEQLAQLRQQIQPPQRPRGTFPYGGIQYG